MKNIIEGLLFATLWASATVATKFAIHSVDPFLLTLIRFSLVAILLQLYGFICNKNQSLFPPKNEIKPLMLLGLFNPDYSLEKKV